MCSSLCLAQRNVHGIRKQKRKNLNRGPHPEEELKDKIDFLGNAAIVFAEDENLPPF